MHKPWLGKYPDGVAAEIAIGADASIRQILEASCERFAGLPAYHNLGDTISYRELDRLSALFATWLQQVAGLRKGERVALMMPNLLQYPVALFGALRAGLVVVNVNPLLAPRELEGQLVDSGARVVVVLENFAHALQQVIGSTQVRWVVTTRAGDLLRPLKAALSHLLERHGHQRVAPWKLDNAVAFPAALRAAGGRKLQRVELGPEDVAFLQYAGANAGIAKGAVLTHGNIVANVQQLSAWMGGDLQPGRETAAIPLPLYHVYALISALVFLRIGAQALLIANPRELPGFIRELEQTPVTAIIGVNNLYAALLDAPQFPTRPLRELKFACAGGRAMQRSVAERWKQATGVSIVEGYGLTEASPVVTSNRLDIEDWTGSVGLPLPSTELAVVDAACNSLPAGQVGELVVRGPQVMRGYWNRRAETAKVLSADGWLHTGDMGCFDDTGYFRITARKHEVVAAASQESQSARAAQAAVAQGQWRHEAGAAAGRLGAALKPGAPPQLDQGSPGAG